MNEGRNPFAPWVLVVDPDPPDRFLLRQVLEKEGARVLLADSAEQAAGILRESRVASIAAAFVARPRPGTSKTIIRSRGKRVPIVLLLGGDVPNSPPSSLEIGRVIDVLWKPFSREEVRRTLRRVASLLPKDELELSAPTAS